MDFISFYINEKFVGQVKILQDQKILDVTGPTGGLKKLKGRDFLD